MRAGLFKNSLEQTWQPLLFQCYPGQPATVERYIRKTGYEEKETELYYWAKLLAAKDWKEVDDTIKGNPYREAVKDEMYKMSQDERERYLYLREEMAYSDEISRMKTAREEGLEEGRKEERKESNYFYNV